MFSREALRLAWTTVRPYCIFAMMLFFAAMIVGGTPNEAAGFIEEQVRGIAELARQAENAENPQMAFFWIIFERNATAVFFTMYLGIAAGIFPLFTMALNGMVLGFVFGEMADQGHNVLPYIVKGILPHGILELPALFLAAGFGMLLGVSALKGVFGSLFGKNEPWGLFVRAIKGTVPAAVLLLVLLLLAAIIESTITYSLMT
jgi:stage II sporulation protein M